MQPLPGAEQQLQGRLAAEGADPGSLQGATQAAGQVRPELMRKRTPRARASASCSFKLVAERTRKRGVLFNRDGACGRGKESVAREL